MTSSLRHADEARVLTLPEAVATVDEFVCSSLEASFERHLPFHRPMLETSDDVRMTKSDVILFGGKGATNKIMETKRMNRNGRASRSESALH